MCMQQDLLPEHFFMPRQFLRVESFPNSPILRFASDMLRMSMPVSTFRLRTFTVTSALAFSYWYTGSSPYTTRLFGHAKVMGILGTRTSEKRPGQPRDKKNSVRLSAASGNSS
jgi:hypothetical protein